MKIVLYFLGFILLMFLVPLILGVLLCSVPFITVYYVIDRIYEHNELKRGLRRKEKGSGIFENLFENYAKASKAS